MSILFAASELDGFTLSSTTNITGDTTSGRFDSAVARAAIRAAVNATVQVDFTAQTDIWVHFVLNHETTTTLSGNWLCRLIDSASGDDAVIQLRGDSTAVDLDILNASTSTFTTLANDIKYRSTNMANNTNYAERGYIPGVSSNQTWDIHLVMLNAGGTIDVYQDGILVTTFTGDTLRAANTQVDRLALSNNEASASEDAWFSEIIVADEDTRAMRLATLAPTADGANTAWTGTFADIDETALNDTDLITSAVANAKETFTASNLPTGDYDVAAVVSGFRSREAVATGQLRGIVRTGGTDFNGATQTAAASFDGLYEVWNTNPNTTNPWTPTEVDGLEFGVELIGGTVEVSKTTAFAVLRPATDEVVASKVTAYAVLAPGAAPPAGQLSQRQIIIVQ